MLHIHWQHWRLHIVVVSNVHNQLPVEVRCGGSLVIVGDVNGRLALLHYTIRIIRAPVFVRRKPVSMKFMVAMFTRFPSFRFHIVLHIYKHKKCVRRMHPLAKNIGIEFLRKCTLWRNNAPFGEKYWH